MTPQEWHQRIRENVNAYLLHELTLDELNERQREVWDCIIASGHRMAVLKIIRAEIHAKGLV